MKGTFLAIALHIVLAGVLYATTNPDILLAKAEFHDRQAYIQIWDGSANVVIDCITYDLTGDAITDPYGGVTLLESPTGNAVTIFADGSADVYVGGVFYQFEAE